MSIENLKMSFSPMESDDITPASNPATSFNSVADGITRNMEQSLSLSGIAHMIGLDFATLQSKASSKMKEYVQSWIAKGKAQIAQYAGILQLDPTIISVTGLTTILADRMRLITSPSNWNAHMLAIMANESNLNPSAYAQGKTTLHGKELPYAVYGLLQMVKGTWMSSIDYFHSQPWTQALTIKGLTPKLARGLGFNLDKFMSPYDSWGPNNAPSMQIIPVLGFSMKLSDWIRTNFSFDTKLGWQPTSKVIATSLPWAAIKSSYGDYLRNYDAGLQTLMTLATINGFGMFNISAKPTGMERVPKDLRSYLGFLDNPITLDCINSAGQGLIKMLPALGPIASAYSTITNVAPKGDPLGWHTPAIHPHGGYGWRKIDGKDQFHAAFDFPQPEGTDIYLPAPGTVVVSAFYPDSGNTVIVKHDNNWSTSYSHLLQPGPAPGTRVNMHQPFAKVGTTGRSSGPHLHWKVRNPSGLTVNPNTSPFDTALLFRLKRIQ